MLIQPGDQPIPGYRLVARLGRGGIGEVWRATAPGETSVALKFINLAGKPGQKELRALQRVKEVRHANLTPVQAFWLLDAEGDILDEPLLDAQAKPKPAPIRATLDLSRKRPATLVVAMLLGDGSLNDRLQECRKEGLTGIPVEELLGYMEESAKGIDYLNSPRHELGGGEPAAIQHCDIKPQNILLVGGSASVCDFGLARALGPNQATSIMGGSPAYMAPECIEGNKPSHATDQYSLAISYVELRTGELPFTDVSYAGVIEAHLRERLDLSRLSPAEAKVIRRATARKPQDRFATSTEMVRALRAAVESESSDGHASAAPPHRHAVAPAAASVTPTSASAASVAPASAAAASSPRAAASGAATPPAATSPAASSPAAASPPHPAQPPAGAQASRGQDSAAVRQQVVSLVQQGKFETALDLIDSVPGLFGQQDAEQLREATRRRWHQRTIEPMLEACHFAAALEALDAAGDRLLGTHRPAWYGQLVERWSRFAAGRLRQSASADASPSRPD